MIFLFNDSATTEIYTLSLHDALPLCDHSAPRAPGSAPRGAGECGAVGSTGPGRRRRPPAARGRRTCGDRKSTRLNSSHANISYAVFCLKKNWKGADSTSRLTNDMSDA